MAEINFKIEVPEGLEKRTEAIMEKLVKQIIYEIKFSLAVDILKESELTEEQTIELGREVNSAVAKKHS
jgi:hypothetical protein